MNAISIKLKFLTLIAFTSIVCAAPQKTNVILIMADDLGYYDIGCYGHPKIKTPVLDALAKDGIRLTSFYSGATVCTPSRMALMTGAYPSRIGWKQGVVGYKMGFHDGMSPQALTMAEIFKSEGYTTGISGKWHIGDQPETRPGAQGFDFSYFIAHSNNQTRETWRGEKIVEENNVNRLLTEQFTTEAILFIKENKDNPFFLYLPYTAPHFPEEPHPDWEGKSGFGNYGDVVIEVDHRIGQIVDLLRELNIYNKTLIVFTSDNGPNPNKPSNCLPYRGSKWSALEGGTRVPCIFHLPGVIPSGLESDKIVAAIDLLPTLCTACGIDWKKKSTGSPPIDGKDSWDIMLGKKDAMGRDDILYWHGMGDFHAIRQGDWKLFFDRQTAVTGLGTERKTPDQSELVEKISLGNAPLLFNVTEDPGETIDLSGKYPEKVEQLKTLAGKRIEEIRTGNIIPIHTPAP